MADRCWRWVTLIRRTEKQWRGYHRHDLIMRASEPPPWSELCRAQRRSVSEQQRQLLLNTAATINTIIATTTTTTTTTNNNNKCCCCLLLRLLLLLPLLLPLDRSAAQYCVPSGGCASLRLWEAAISRRSSLSMVSIVKSRFQLASTWKRPGSTVPSLLFTHAMFTRL